MSQRTSPFLLASIPAIFGIGSCSLAYGVVLPIVVQRSAGSYDYYFYLVPLLIGALATVLTYLRIHRVPETGKSEPRVFMDTIRISQPEMIEPAEVTRKSSGLSPWAVFGSVIGVSAAVGAALMGLYLTQVVDSGTDGSFSQVFGMIGGGMLSGALLGGMFSLPIAIVAAIAIAIAASRRSSRNHVAT